MKVRRRPLLGASLLTAMGCAERATRDDTRMLPYEQLSTAGDIPKTLVVGATPFKGANTIKAVKKLTNFLAQHLNTPVRAVVANEYGALEKMVNAKEVHVGIFSPAAFTHARANLKAYPIATASAAGSPTYLGYFIIRKQPGGRPKLEDFRGKRIAYVHPKSTSGYLFPRDLLRDRGHDPNTFFTSVMAGDHERAMARVLRGEVEVAAVSSGFINNPGPDAPTHLRELDVIAKTRRIPLDCVVLHESLRRDLGGKLFHLLVDDLVEQRAHSKALYSEWGIHGFARYVLRRYDTVARVIACDAGDRNSCHALRSTVG